MKKVYGVGINDSASPIKGCRFYATWRNMLQRCYSESYQDKRPSYKGCIVCNEWLTFSTFRAWMEQQDHQGKQLDKDIITPGNKLYCPDRCVFVTQEINSLLTVTKSNKGEQPLGVSFLGHKPLPRPYLATVRYGNNLERLGYYSDPLSAHLAWNRRKRDIIAAVAFSCTDHRIAAGLALRVDALDLAYENKAEITCL